MIDSYSSTLNDEAEKKILYSRKMFSILKDNRTGNCLFIKEKLNMRLNTAFNFLG